MFVTLEKLQEAKACSIGVEWFKNHYPNGTTLKELASNPETPKEFMHWGYQYLNSTEEERKIFWDRLNIKCEEPLTVILSENILNSKEVSRSKEVENSQYVFASKKISNGYLIQSSREVIDSSLIFSSKKIKHSKKVYKSTDIVNSEEILYSIAIKNSKNILHGENIEKSYCVIGSKEKPSVFITDSFFITNSSQLSRSLFCFGIENKDLYMFNQKISEAEYVQYRQELLQLFNDFHFDFLINLPTTDSFPVLPSPNDVKECFKKLPMSFMEWVKTLPGYDETILLNILNYN
jgi:hypothetical protein